MLSKGFFIFNVLKCFDSQHGDGVFADSHLGLQVFAKEVVESKRGHTPRFANHCTGLHSAQIRTRLDNNIVKRFSIVKLVFKLVLVSDQKHSFVKGICLSIFCELGVISGKRSRHSLQSKRQIDALPMAHQGDNAGLSLYSRCPIRQRMACSRFFNYQFWHFFLDFL